MLTAKLTRRAAPEKALVAGVRVVKAISEIRGRLSEPPRISTLPPGVFDVPV